MKVFVNKKLLRRLICWFSLSGHDFWPYGNGSYFRCSKCGSVISLLDVGMLGIMHKGTVQGRWKRYVTGNEGLSEVELYKVLGCSTCSRTIFDVKNCGGCINIVAVEAPKQRQCDWIEEEGVRR